LNAPEVKAEAVFSGKTQKPNENKGVEWTILDSNGLQNLRENEEKEATGGEGGDCWPLGTKELLSIWLALDDSARRDLLIAARSLALRSVDSKDSC